MNELGIEASDDMSVVLKRRDQLLINSPEFVLLKENDGIENEAIRELGEIVLTATAPEQVIYSCT